MKLVVSNFVVAAYLHGNLTTTPFYLLEAFPPFLLVLRDAAIWFHVEEEDNPRRLLFLF